MRPKRLKLSAFGPYASIVELDMEKLGMKGLYLITGEQERQLFLMVLSMLCTGCQVGKMRTGNASLKICRSACAYGGGTFF